jgi:hypothetical protein
MILSLDPLSLYYVGKSGKRKTIDLTRIKSMSRGVYNPASPQVSSSNQSFLSFISRNFYF